MDSVLLSVLFIVVVTATTSGFLMYAGYRMGIMAPHVDRKASLENRMQAATLEQAKQQAQLKAPGL